MPLTPQEQHCIDLALGALGDLYGGTWRVPDGPTLDDLHKSQASPECLVTNDLISAAVEVKRLTGDSVLQAYREALMSLNRSLTPSCGGYYTLSPTVDFRLPIDGSLRRHLKEEIERVAPALVRGGAPGAVHIPRKAHVSMSREDGPGYLNLLSQLHRQPCRRSVASCHWHFPTCRPGDARAQFCHLRWARGVSRGSRRCLPQTR